MARVAKKEDTGIKGEPNRETLGNGRVVIHADGVPSVYEDTGDVYDADEVRMLAALDPGSNPLDFEGKIRRNEPIYFWVPESPDPQTKRMEPNPVRGFVLAVFRRPSWMGSDDEPTIANAENTTEKAPRVRLVAWLLTTHPTLGRNRDKELEVIPPGRVLWIDINQAISNLPLRAAPKMNPAGGDPLEIYEIAIDPKYKKPIGNGPDNKPRQAWRMDLYGGKDAQRDGYRTFDSAQIKAIRGLIRIPEVGQINPEDFPELDAPTKAPALPAAPIVEALPAAPAAPALSN